MKGIVAALALAGLVLGVGGARAQGVDMPAFAADSAQCSGLGTEWTATWQQPGPPAGEVARSDAFSLIVYDGRLTVQGLPCGKSVWKIAKVCVSPPPAAPGAPGQVLWVMWTDPMQSRLEWGLPYAPEQVAVLGECRFEQERWRPLPDGQPTW